MKMHTNNEPSSTAAMMGLAASADTVGTGKRVTQNRAWTGRTPGKTSVGTGAPFARWMDDRWRRAARFGLATFLAVGLACPMAGCASLMAGSPKENATETREPIEAVGTIEEGQASSSDAYSEMTYETEEACTVGEAEELYADTCEPYACYYDEPFNTEEYAAVEESGFVAVATSPLSTVSADVDTASYCNLRRMLYQGYAAGDIPAGSVRIEEMLNYFSYDYATPEGDELFGTTVTMGDCPWNPDTKLLVMGFSTAPEDVQAQQDAGRNLVFLIDSSGSMDEPDKLPLLKDAFGELLDGLGENDRVSIVTYAGSEEVLAEGVPGDRKRELMRAIRGIRPDGSTNGQAGLAMAYELAQDNYIDGGVNRIIMASDGDLNVGITSESDLHDYVSDMRDTGIYLSVLGFGQGNYKDTKMETLADDGNGQYHYIDCEEEAERVFGQNLTANLVPLADDVKLQVEFNPAQVKGYRLVGYENRAMEDAEFEDEAADAGDVGPGSQFTVAYEIVPVDSKMEVPAADLKYGDADADATAVAGDEWATCTMRYKPVSGGAGEQQVVVRGEDLSEDPGADWEFVAGVIEFGMLLRGSDYVGTASYESAYGLVDSAAGDDELRCELGDLIKMAQENSQYVYDGGDDDWYYLDGSGDGNWHYLYGEGDEVTIDTDGEA